MSLLLKHKNIYAISVLYESKWSHKLKRGKSIKYCIGYGVNANGYYVSNS